MKELPSIISAALLIQRLPSEQTPKPPRVSIVYRHHDLGAIQDLTASPRAITVAVEFIKSWRDPLHTFSPERADKMADVCHVRVFTSFNKQYDRTGVAT